MYRVELKMLTRPFQASPRIKSSSLLQLRAWPGGSELECRVRISALRPSLSTSVRDKRWVEKKRGGLLQAYDGYGVNTQSLISEPPRVFRF